MSISLAFFFWGGGGGGGGGAFLCQPKEALSVLELRLLGSPYIFSDIQTKDEVLIPPYSRVTLSVRCRVLYISLCLFRRLSLRSRSEVAGSKHESWARIQSDGWMDELRFYVLFNSISVISG